MAAALRAQPRCAGPIADGAFAVEGVAGAGERPSPWPLGVTAARSAELKYQTARLLRYSSPTTSTESPNFSRMVREIASKWIVEATKIGVSMAPSALGGRIRTPCRLRP